MKMFADTSFWLALLRPRDQYHTIALRWKVWLIAHATRIVTTEPILWEWMNLSSATSFRKQAADSFRDCHEDDRIQIIEWKPRWASAAFALFEERADKEWSLTDCFSFEVMRKQGLTAALTADHHFRQAGHRALLLEEPPESQLGPRAT